MGRSRLLAALVLIAAAPAGVFGQNAAAPPQLAPAAAPAPSVLRFRHVEPQMKLSVAETPALVRFVVDDAFPPWSWRPKPRPPRPSCWSEYLFS